jgi:Tfp pilus assembly protein PilF
MASNFLSPEEYDEKAHSLYNEGDYEGALELLREGLGLYPGAVDLHVGVGYARLAREEYAWARRAFEEALVLDGEHEDALAGLGEVMLRFGQPEAAVATFRRTLELGFQDDLDLMLQVGRALFREGMPEEAREYFEIAAQQAPDNAEAVALVGYAQHRAGEEELAIATLRRALQLDAEHAEARIYLANVLYDRGEYEAALYHLDRTVPDDHWDELGIWRLMELKQSVYKLKETDKELEPWQERLADLAGEPDDIAEMLAEIEARFAEEVEREQRGQLELFGALLGELAEREAAATEQHEVATRDGQEFSGTWEEIVRQLRDANAAFTGRSLHEFMQTEARRHHSLTGVKISHADYESFIRGSANAGLLRILK